MDPIIAFFALGLLAGFLKTDLKFSSQLTEFCMVVLLLTIGLKGGIHLHNENLVSLLPQILLVLALGLIIPIIAYSFLSRVGKINRIDAASIAAHYGSVSVGTFAICVAYLKNNEISFEPYVPLFVIILEVPAIIVGLVIAKKNDERKSFSSLVTETFRSQAVVLLLGGLLIGWLAGETRLEPYSPFFFKLFYGVLALFLVDMGISVSERMKGVLKYGPFMLAFGIGMPLVAGSIAMFCGHLMGLSLGGTVVLTVLGASASYIAVPAAMKISLPEANLSLSLGSSLGITFPFNVVLGIPIYLSVAQYFFY